MFYLETVDFTIMCFVDSLELEADRFYSNAEMYGRFLKYGGTISKASFLKRLPPIMRERRPDIRQYRGTRGRGWRFCDS